jgi:glycosyltransferase involved in cell wall biosynthesis
MQESFLISVVICTYNRDKFLPLALESLAKQSLDPSLWELILIDNNCTDNTAIIAKSFIDAHPKLHCTYYLEMAQGLSHARNRGIVMARGTYISFIDDDAVACPDYLCEIQSFIKTYPDSTLIGGRIYPRFEGLEPRWISPLLMPIFSTLDLGDQEKKLSGKRYPVGANMIFRRSIFDTIGLFNPELGRVGKNMMGGEEKDIYLRIIKVGGHIYYAPKPFVHHIIPIERATKTFIEKQAIGVGLSEKTRVKERILEKIKSYVRELIKWAVSCALALYYVMSFRPAKAGLLLSFRWWVSKGLL